MTLNITIASALGIYQCADFRLSAFDKDSRGQWIPKIHNSPKIITLSYGSWVGCLTYCGIGMWDSKQTYEVAADWLTDPNRGQISFDQAIEIITASGSAWIKAIIHALGRFHPHTFVVAGYENDTPRVALVSNTHSTKGTLPKPKDGGLIASSTTSNDTHVWITGIDNAVRREDRLLLKRLASTADHNVVRVAMAKVNTRASQSKEANNGISDACMCYSLDRHGNGSGEVLGKVPGPLVPIQIQAGMNLTKLFSGALALGAEQQLRSMTSATSKSSNAVAAQKIACDLAFAYPGNDSPYTVEEFGSINEFHVEVSALNSKRTMVGQMRYPIASSPHAFLWADGQQIVDLGTLGGPFSSAADVNSTNVVVGSSHTADGVSHAVRWESTSGMIDLGTLGGDSSIASAINDRNEIVGVSYHSASTPAAKAQGAFIWTERSGMRAIPGLPNCWSYASDINNRGWVAGWYRTDLQTCGFVWSEETGFISIDGPSGRPFFVCGINDAGVVVGAADDEQGTRRAMVWAPESALRPLNIAIEFHPIDIDEAGNVIGSDYAVPWARSWLYTPQGQLVQLPYAENHHTNARAISGGLIVGSASKESWKHTHPIAWTPKSAGS